MKYFDWFEALSSLFFYISAYTPPVKLSGYSAHKAGLVLSPVSINTSVFVSSDVKWARSASLFFNLLLQKWIQSEPKPCSRSRPCKWYWVTHHMCTISKRPLLQCISLHVCVCVVVMQPAHTHCPGAVGSSVREEIPVTGSGVRGANQTPGTCSQATLFVVDTWGFSTHKDKEG